MALAPQFVSHRLGRADARHVLELYVCPFSAKIVASVRDKLLPLLKDRPEQLSIVFRQTPQPWHASSTLVHEAGIAVSRLAPEKFWTFSYALFADQAQYFDEPTADEPASKTRIRLADLAVKSAGVDKYQFLDLVTTGKGNSGSKVTGDLKLQVKLGRQNGIHVTPTAVLDGLVDGSVSSSFDTDDWQDWLKKLS